MWAPRPSRFFSYCRPRVSHPVCDGPLGSRWMARRSGHLAAPPTPVERARGDSGGSGPRTSYGGPTWRCASTSITRWESRTPSRRPAAALELLCVQPGVSAALEPRRRCRWRPPTPYRQCLIPVLEPSRMGPLPGRLEPGGRPRVSPSLSESFTLDGGASPGSRRIRWSHAP